MNKEKFKILKIIILIVFVIFAIFLTIKFFPLFKSLSTGEGREIFKTDIQNSGIGGAAVIIGLMLLQILLAFLPGEPIEILAGMCYGPILGTIIIFIGALLSSSIIFFAVRKFGRGFIYTFVKENKVRKIEENKLFSSEEKIELFMFFVFFTPGTPKDLFVYIGGLLPVNPIRFLTIATFARFPSVISSTFAGSSVMNGDWLSVIIVYAVSFALSGIVVLVTRWLHKRNTQVKDGNNLK